MKNYAVLLFLMILLVNCSISNNSGQPQNIKKVSIRTGGIVTSTFDIDSTTNNIVSSEAIDSNGVVTTRSYLYDKNNKDLIRVSRYNKYEGTGLVYFNKSVNRSTNKVEEEIKTVTNLATANRASSENKYTVKYIYDDDGKLVGIVQTDKYGNIIAKSNE